jgi:exopolysaccharide biosynthesis polyprenyl glycosylphosphotransferase
MFVEPKLDLRAPILTRLRKGVGLAYLRAAALILIDFLLLSVAWQLADTYGTPLKSSWSIEGNPFSLLLILTTIVGLLAVQGFYQSREKRHDYLGLVKTLSFSHLLLVFIAFLSQPGLFVSRSTFLLAWGLSVVLVCTGRLAANVAVSYLRKRGTGCYPVFLIGSPEDTSKAMALLHQEKCYKILGVADTSSTDQAVWKQTLNDLCHLGATEVFICSWDKIKNRVFLYWSLRNAGVTLHILPINLETLYRKSELRIVGGLPSIQFSPPLVTGSDFYIKRCFDFCCAALLLLMVSPVFLLISCLIKLDSPGPIFYKQTRIGLHGQPFKVWKFRTMVTNAEQLQYQLEAQNETQDGVLFKIKDDPRVTRIGKFLRRYSLDELPQILNVIRAEMSLVGPRPLPERDVERFSEHHFIRQEVLPGITGLWQVSGRSDITNFEEVIHLDTTYIGSWSLWLDLQILLQTVQVVFQKTGAY